MLDLFSPLNGTLFNRNPSLVIHDSETLFNIIVEPHLGDIFFGDAIKPIMVEPHNGGYTN